MPKGQYGLPSLYGQQHGKMTFGAVMSPFQQPPPQGTGNGGVGRLPPPQTGNPPGQYPPGTHQIDPLGGGNGLGTLNSGSPFTNGVGMGQGGGKWYTPQPTGVTAGYAFRPRQFGADANVDTTSAFYRQNMGAYNPTDPKAQGIWNVMPVQDRLEVSSWAAAGAGAYSDAILKAWVSGPQGGIIDGQYMSGDQAVEYIKGKARQYMAQLAQARQQNKPQPQPTPFRIGV